MYTMKSDRLTVQVAKPNKEDLTCRFDRAGFITSVVLDGQYEFCSEEGGGSFGKGLCSEIQCDPLSNEVAVGDTFFKFGVGILTKTEERPYMILNQYPCEDFEVTADAKDDCIVFRTEPKDCKGYAAAEQKTLSVKGNVITTRTEDASGAYSRKRISPLSCVIAPVRSSSGRSSRSYVPSVTSL